MFLLNRILPLVKKHHLLLVTLLLANAAAMETLPIFLDKVVPTWVLCHFLFLFFRIPHSLFLSTQVAIVLSVTLVLLFGEYVF
jgi:metal transporter CNNM